MSDAILKAEGVCFGYKRDKAVLSGVSLSFKRGELTGIIGPNGSGKTTLIKLLSGGEMQRVIIARALTQQTDVMLLDEPVASLDVRHAAHILRLSRDLAHKQQVCGVCVLHDLSLAGWFCDRIALMCAGEVYAYGFPADVLTARAIADVYGVGADIIADGGHVRVLARYESTI